LKIIGAPIEFDLIMDPATSIEQCKNGKPGSHEICHDEGGNQDNWVTGNVNGQQAHWAEGQFLPYRAIVTGVDVTGSYQSLFEFDTVKRSELKHAIDYLSSYNLTETTGVATANNENQIDPCGGHFTCDANNPDSFAPIPVPPGLTTAFPSGCAGGSFSVLQLPTTGIMSGWINGGGILTINDVTFTNLPITVEKDCGAEFQICKQ